MSPKDLEKLRKKLTSLRQSPCSMKSVAFRSTGLKYASETDLISGSGAAYYGGRWNPIRMRAIYASLDPVTAATEAFQQFLNYGFPLSGTIKPRVIAGIEFKCSVLLDLTQAAIRRSLGIRLDDILKEPWLEKQRNGTPVLTQSIAVQAVAVGFEGILTFSAQNRKGMNIVIFPDSLDRRSFVRVLSPKDLPPHPTNSGL
jgi:RES domain-containing protein